MEKKKPEEKNGKKVEVDKKEINKWLENFSMSELSAEMSVPLIKRGGSIAETPVQSIEQAVSNALLTTEEEDKKKKTEQKYTNSASFSDVAGSYQKEEVSETIARIDDLRRLGMFVDRKWDFSPIERPRVRMFDLPEFKQEGSDESKYVVEARDTSSNRIPEFMQTEKRIDLRKYKKQMQ